MPIWRTTSSRDGECTSMIELASRVAESLFDILLMFCRGAGLLASRGPECFRGGAAELPQAEEYT